MMAAECFHFLFLWGSIDDVAEPACSRKKDICNETNNRSFVKSLSRDIYLFYSIALNWIQVAPLKA